MPLRQPSPAAAAVLSGVPLLLLALGAAACRPGGRQYEMKGQIVAVDPARQELTIRHQDIPGFMPGMTMAFKVGKPDLMAGRAAGELVTATLIVDGGSARLQDVARTGFAPVVDGPGETRVMDLVEPGQAVRDTTLIDESGARKRLADWRGQVLAVTFTYTRCPLPNFCPLIERHFKAVQTAIRDDADLRGRAQLLSVSIDPEHDSPAVLAGRAAALGADPAVWHFLSGEPSKVESFAGQFGVSAMRDGTSPGEIVHNLRTAIIDGEGRLVTTLSGSEWTPADLVAEVRRAHATR